MKYILFFLVFTTTFFGQEVNKVDAQGQKDGLWKGIYEESKRPRYEGTFEHGKEVGTFKYNGYFEELVNGTSELNGSVSRYEDGKIVHSCCTIS